MTTLREGIAEMAAERTAHTTVMTSNELRTWRSGHGMTQAEASNWVGISRRTWIRYEMDERTIPRWLRIIVVSVPAASARRR